MRCLVMYRPRPLPETSLVEELSARKNLVKRRAWSSAEIPIPLSEIVMRTESAAFSAISLTCEPSGEYLQALLSRLLMTCASLSLSPISGGRSSCISIISSMLLSLNWVPMPVTVSSTSEERSSSVGFSSRPPDSIREISSRSSTRDLSR